MTITQINHFIAVAETLSFTQAANMLYVSQPAISKSVSKLEEYLGFKLFERSETSLSLTPSGNSMYEFFTKTTREFNSLTDDIRAAAKLPAQTLRIGCPETWSPANFYNKIESYFSERHPEIKLNIECYKLSDLIARLHADKLDIVLTHDFFIPALPNISAKDSVSTTFGILYSKEHFPSVSSIRAFAKTPFLLFDNDIEKRFSDVIRRICSKHGLSPKIINCGQLPSALFNTACGKGVMLFSSWDSAVSNPSFGFLPLDEIMPIKIIHFTDNSIPKISRYVEELRSLLM
ncbi:MAG: LysR family transcriptional regulator [Oscillospiraceae bacterium]|nr:LysR family transcriptional regulator [Oscillospiraceae bacterium]